ncbi:MAG: hypothetical protein LBB20_02615 [Puniceicoccales bacterium]|jgi:hypothetical protein|nr:hypothetical protein [Puniceicoccales bacterium]
MDFNPELMDFLVSNQLISQSAIVKHTDSPDNGHDNGLFDGMIKGSVNNLYGKIISKDSSISNLNLANGVSSTCKYMILFGAYYFPEGSHGKPIGSDVNAVYNAYSCFMRILNAFPDFLLYPLDINGTRFPYEDIKKTFLYNMLSFIADQFRKAVADSDETLKEACMSWLNVVYFMTYVIDSDYIGKNCVKEIFIFFFVLNNGLWDLYMSWFSTNYSSESENLNNSTQDDYSDPEIDDDDDKPKFKLVY